ncbi:MAG: hypothetical protein JW807_13430 [Spirochaetes bacterium]|nr:hypothetical protein [Spirochaetota bacterium]
MPKHAETGATLICALAVFRIVERSASARESLPAGLGGMAESFKEIADVLAGINTFISGVSFISDTIGFSTIILFIAVLVLSAGYSAAGVPRGKASFLAALVTADALWAVWKSSFGTAPADYLPAMAKSSCIVLAPMAAAAVLKRVWPCIAPRIRRAAGRLFRRGRSLRREEFLDIYKKYESHSARLRWAVMADILAAGDGDRVDLSPETRMNINALKRTLSDMDRGGGRNTRE